MRNIILSKKICVTIYVDISNNDSLSFRNLPSHILKYKFVKLLFIYAFIKELHPVDSCE